MSLCLSFFHLWLQPGLPRVGFAGDCDGKFPNPATVEVTLALPCPVSPAAVKKHSLQVRILLRYRKNPRYWATG